LFLQGSRRKLTDALQASHLQKRRGTRKQSRGGLAEVSRRATDEVANCSFARRGKKAGKKCFDVEVREGGKVKDFQQYVAAGESGRLRKGQKGPRGVQKE